MGTAGASTGSSGSTPDGDSGLQQALLGAREAVHHGELFGGTRLSRKEILELSALYIGTVEKERERWKEEREELLADNRRLREKCGE
jgi:hypothetical protein